MIRISPLVSDPFVARAVLVTDALGRDHVLLVVKAAWSIPVDASSEPSVQPTEVRTVPLLDGDRGGASIRVPSDIAPSKPGTEVLLLGHARRPAAYPDARWVDVTLAIEGDTTRLSKRLRVFGERTWVQTAAGWAPSEPGPSTDVPLSWAAAFGGASDARNPIGSGADARTRAGGPCHRIEHPESGPLHPAGFGPLAPHWEPRRSRAGSQPIDDLAPHPPADRDPRHYCSAPDDQWLADPLRGDETFVVTGVHAERAWTFRLPQLEPALSWTIRGRTERALPHLDTVLLDADDETVTLSWRVSFLAPRSVSDLEELVVRPRRLLGPTAPAPVVSATPRLARP